MIQREELPMDYSADYWEKRYTMRPERIPVFLNDHAQTILRTGKYFNVIRQCGMSITVSYSLRLDSEKFSLLFS